MNSYYTAIPRAFWDLFSDEHLLACGRVKRVPAIKATPLQSKAHAVEHARAKNLCVVLVRPREDGLEDVQLLVDFSNNEKPA